MGGEQNQGFTLARHAFYYESYPHLREVLGRQINKAEVNGLHRKDTGLISVTPNIALKTPE